MNAVDLRSDIETVYHQSNTNACTAHAVVNALDAMYDHAGRSKRFSRAWVWWWARSNSNRAGLDVGASYADLKFALEKKGVVTEEAHPWTGVAFNPPPEGLTATTKVISFLPMLANVDDIKRKLCLGVPVILGMTVHQELYSLFGAKDWRTHKYDVRAHAIGSDHYVCIVGYDDTAGRLLIENSWGPGFGDGGFFGLPYEDFIHVQRECCTIDRIEGFAPKKVEGYVSIPYLLSNQDTGAFASKNRHRLMQMLAEALQSGGYSAVLGLCREWHITDKHLEHLFKWERGAVRAFREANLTLDWAGFPWAEL